MVFVHDRSKEPPYKIFVITTFSFKFLIDSSGQQPATISMVLAKFSTAMTILMKTLNSWTWAWRLIITKKGFQFPEQPSWYKSSRVPSSTSSCFVSWKRNAFSLLSTLISLKVQFRSMFCLISEKLTPSLAQLGRSVLNSQSGP